MTTSDVPTASVLGHTSYNTAESKLDRKYFTCTIVNMNIVSDTNIFLAVTLNEPEKDAIIAVTSNASAISPEILPYEIGNALTAMVKRKQLTPTDAQVAFGMSQSIPVRLVSVDIQKALEIALKHNIYAYDAYFLQCAIKLTCPLLTLDKRMRKIARSLNIDVME